MAAMARHRAAGAEWTELATGQQPKLGVGAGWRGAVRSGQVRGDRAGTDTEIKRQGDHWVDANHSSRDVYAGYIEKACACVPYIA